MAVEKLELQKTLEKTLTTYAPRVDIFYPRNFGYFEKNRLFQHPQAFTLNTPGRLGSMSVMAILRQLGRGEGFRSEREKSDIAPLFVPRDKSGYLIITCPKCLRPNRLEAMNLNGGIHQTICQSCRTPVKFEINHEIDLLR